MSVISDIVRELLDATGLRLPRAKSFIVLILATIAVAFPAAFATGVIWWSNEQACNLDHQYVPLITVPNIPRMQVVERNGKCIVMPVTPSVEPSHSGTKS